MSEFMINITDAAAEHISSKLKKAQGKSHFRLGVKRTGCSGWMYTPEFIVEPDDNDQLAATINNMHIYINKEHTEVIH